MSMLACHSAVMPVCSGTGVRFCLNTGLVLQYGGLVGAGIAGFRSSPQQLPLHSQDRGQPLRDSDYIHDGIMGWGGYLTLLNGSPNDWTVSSQHAYQMDAWNWPTIEAGKAAKVYVEFGTSGNIFDDAGEAYYDIDGTSNNFQVQARRDSDWMLTITLDDLATKQSPKGSSIDIGFRHNAAVNWIMSTDEAGDWWSNSGTYTDWMQQSLGSLGNRTLKQICMPGSHDAGMSSFSPGTVGANYANTQTQYFDFYDQLMAGSRYFDLRPVISAGEWVSGHYSSIGDLWLGGNGQSLSSIIQQINDFTAEYHELIIINVSHTLDTDADYDELSQSQWDDLISTFKGINSRFTPSSPLSPDTDLSEIRLDDFIGSDSASVLIIVQIPSDRSLSDDSAGIHPSSNFPLYDSYSNTNDRTTMINDQLSKLVQQRNLVSDASQRRDTFHILSWTLSQQPEDVLNPEKAIMNLAIEALDPLFVRAFNAFTPQSYPNVLYVDALGVREQPVQFPYEEVEAGLGMVGDVRALAVAVNNAMAGRNGWVTGGGGG